MTPSKKLRSGFAYIRVSTHDQEELSPDSQERILRDYAKNNNIVLEQIYIDSGISGRKAEKRPAFQEMIARAKSKEHPVDVLLVWKFSRFARNQEESIVYKSLLKKAGVEVLSVSEPLVDGPFGSLIERIIEWMDEYYSIRLSGEVKRGMTENARRGRYQSIAPFGYRNVPEGLEIVPEEAEIVRVIFRKFFHEHFAFSKLASYLNDRSIRTHRGGLWENRTVKYVLQNPVYKGYARWNVGHNALRGPDASSPDMILTQGQHIPAIIPEEFFDQVQAEIARQYRQPKARPSESYGHWLGNLVKCSSCGSSLTYSPANAGFQCISYGKGKCKTSHYISAKLLEQAVIDTLSENIRSGSVEYQEELVLPEQSQEEQAILLESMEKLNEKEKRIKAAYQDGIDTLEEYRQNKTLIQSERERLAEQLRILEAALQRPDAGEHQEEMLLRIRSVVDILCSDASKDVKSRSIRSICDKIVFDRASKTLDIYCVFRIL
ncbi:MAG: recombinase family protein [Lachnospiraceae bacterium]|nr:recombinase family protein [Lachnospiraceae bacterium]